MDNILMALQSLKANKMRALLTMLGIIIGIGAVIAIETMGGSLSGSITESLTGFGVSDITVTLTQKEDEDENGDVRLRMFQSAMPSEKDRLTDEMIEEYRRAFPRQVAYIEVTESVGTGSYSGYDTATVTVMGINDEYIAGEDIEILHGRSIDNQKDEGKRLCLVSDEFVKEGMGMAPMYAVGEQIRLGINGTPYSFYIVGVYRYDDSNSLVLNFGTETVTDLYLPMSTAKTLSGGADGYSTLTVITTQETDTMSFMDITEEFFAGYYTRNDTWTASATSLENLVSVMIDMLDTVSIAISAIAAISLLVGGIGVMNIMLVSVTERTREIGTRKALGAPQNAIRLQFIIESVVICLIGGFLGIFVGLGLGALGCMLLGYSAKPDVGVILLVVMISMAIGVFFGYYPANKAAKLDPIEALRYE